MMSNKDNVSIGNSGEYFVAAELERRGFTVAVPMSNVRDFDILAIHRETHTQWAIQVKTTSKKQKDWALSKKNEKLVEKNIVYIFVCLNDMETPEYHIVPSAVVAKRISEDHQYWLSTLGRNGEKHPDINMRRFKDKENIYLNKWEYLDK